MRYPLEAPKSRTGISRGPWSNAPNDGVGYSRERQKGEHYPSFTGVTPHGTPCVMLHPPGMSLEGGASSCMPVWGKLEQFTPEDVPVSRSHRVVY